MWLLIMHSPLWCSHGSCELETREWWNCKEKLHLIISIFWLRILWFWTRLQNFGWESKGILTPMEICTSNWAMCIMWHRCKEDQRVLCVLSLPFGCYKEGQENSYIENALDMLHRVCIVHLPQSLDVHQSTGALSECQASAGPKWKARFLFFT